MAAPVLPGHLYHGVERRPKQVVADHVATDDATYDGAAVKADAHYHWRAVRRTECRAQLLHLQSHAREIEGVLLQRLVLTGNAARRRDEGIPAKMNKLLGARQGIAVYVF